VAAYLAALERILADKFVFRLKVHAQSRSSGNRDIAVGVHRCGVVSRWYSSGKKAWRNSKTPVGRRRGQLQAGRPQQR
jgi:hypothetical protein